MTAKKQAGYVQDREIVDGVMMIRIAGVFTKETTPNICRQVKVSSGKHKIKGIILDFKGVTGVDSSAFACLISVMKDHLKKGLKVGAINLNKEAKAIVEVLRIKSVVCSYKCEETALKAMAKRGKNE
ncbi:MAG: STAS domain-containing protein [Candidatus Omnitrophica bacterium]|nr:STAS domain-containing protein [Candidatus Omnitrophota bacterium]